MNQIQIIKQKIEDLEKGCENKTSYFDHTTRIQNKCGEEFEYVRPKIIIGVKGKRYCVNCQLKLNIWQQALKLAEEKIV
jgi:hypothetical protein